MILNQTSDSYSDCGFVVDMIFANSLIDDMESPTFSGCILTGCTISDLYGKKEEWQSSIFQNCHLINIRLSKTGLTDIQLDSCDLIDFTWPASYLERVKFKNCRYTSAARDPNQLLLLQKPSMMTNVTVGNSKSNEYIQVRNWEDFLKLINDEPGFDTTSESLSKETHLQTFPQLLLS